MGSVLSIERPEVLQAKASDGSPLPSVQRLDERKLQALADLDIVLLSRLGRVPVSSRELCRVLDIAHRHFWQFGHLVELMKLVSRRYYELGLSRAEILLRLSYFLGQSGQIKRAYAADYYDAAQLVTASVRSVRT